jgi:hypothetical protein
VSRYGDPFATERAQALAEAEHERRERVAGQIIDRFEKTHVEIARVLDELDEHRELADEDIDAAHAALPDRLRAIRKLGRLRGDLTNITTAAQRLTSKGTSHAS